jgi:rhodanese-related sulfurtransferase
MNYENLTIVNYESQFFGDKIDHTLIDVRTTSEYASGHIPHAVNIPLDQLARRLEEVPRSRPVVVVCQSGGRSQTASDILAKAGFQKVYNLQGGTSSWMIGMRPMEF